MDEAAYLATLPRKRLAVGLYCRDGWDNLLIVQPTYRPTWLVPGGSVEPDESPYRACQREAQEELGITLTVGRLLCVDYRAAQAAQSESIHFIFDGGVLNASTSTQIVLPADELQDYQFLPFAEAITYLDAWLARRIALARLAVEEQRTIYAEDGKERISE